MDHHHSSNNGRNLPPVPRQQPPMMTSIPQQTSSIQSEPNKLQELIQHILFGFPKLDIFGTAGGLSVYGPNAYPVVLAKSNLFPGLIPVVAAATHGNGRIMVFGHNWYDKFHPLTLIQ
jgi:hypothetical protein